MKKYTGFFVAAGALAVTALITLFAKHYGALLDAFYPYFSRTVQGLLASLSSIFPFTLWQVIVVALGIALVVTLVLVLVLIRRRSILRWLGWVLATASLLWMGHTGLQGLNFYASDLTADLHLELVQITQEELAQAMTYFRDQANALADTLPRDETGALIYDDFDTLAQNAGEGYKALVRRGYSVFAGSTLPVKKLSWSRLYTAMGLCGVTMALTGEAAVNADIPNMSLPFVMCHEMAHRMAIAPEDDANFAGFLACQAHEDAQFRYSAYYMAYRYCYNALAKANRTALAEVHAGAGENLRRDLKYYDEFFTKNKNQTATNVANAANNTYIQASGDQNGVVSYSLVSRQLVSWYLQQEAQEGQTPAFDPTDTDYINGILGENNG